MLTGLCNTGQQKNSALRMKYDDVLPDIMTAQTDLCSIWWSLSRKFMPLTLPGSM